MIPLLAQGAAPAVSDNATSWLVVLALGTLASLALNGVLLVRALSGKANERQVEPTQLHEIREEMRRMLDTLGDINREIGEVRTKVELFEEAVDGLHVRVGAISRDLAGTAAKVEGLERREERS